MGGVFNIEMVKVLVRHNPRGGTHSSLEVPKKSIDVGNSWRV